MRVSGGGLLCGRRTLRGHWRPCRDGYGMGPPNRSGLILGLLVLMPLAGELGRRSVQQVET